MFFSLPIYLLSGFFHQIALFFKRWYAGSFWAYSSRLIGIFHKLEQVFALRVTVRNWFLPLYQDYTALGYIFGFVFRSLRIALSIFVYTTLAIIALIAYVFWLLLPSYLLFRFIAG